MLAEAVMKRNIIEIELQDDGISMLIAFHRHVLTIKLVEDSMHGLDSLFRKHANRTIPLQQLGHLKNGDVYLGCD